MSFEKGVLSSVSDVLDNDNAAVFSYGTLFVTCSEEEARSIFHRLTNTFGLGGVKVSKTPMEYAFDFTAPNLPQ
ncbi:hypothetical protein UFOVP1146_141 [uncultured Caudovirales phage]|jgi:phosphosulfolactate synthase (CoM biosynthesis protein A)|uniref:Uncharacterized protein n=1 Tax=uncultured Caudovirales phage TaxID=2100421 RepID=A0A6J5P2H1_9CAUD|nr:hypothetical protein UFOVP812_54 [uncultured Caudovirales phage]CAB4165553.1 hypothetical protein UFOVP818_89 [uncultured Caudovirales phage]CAB4186795.1 hypothetical protein UFOVP1146_141 [uncultured Caudovirales phage]CAB4220426.1 hypothetical protein UFOVP1638_2 [uncultured Caudovirales phage]